MLNTSSSSFSQRPVDYRGHPLTEWEYQDKHTNDNIDEMSGSSFSSTLGFSIQSDENLDQSTEEDPLAKCQVTEPFTLTDQQILSVNPAVVGGAVKDFGKIVNIIPHSKENEVSERKEPAISENKALESRSTISEFVISSEGELDKPIQLPGVEDVGDSDKDQREESEMDTSELTKTIPEATETVEVPPAIWTRQEQEHPPPKKKVVEEPGRFKYVPEPIKDETPEMLKRDPPKPKSRPQTQQSGRFHYEPRPTRNNPPSFVNSDRSKKKKTNNKEKGLLELADEAQKAFEVRNDEKALEDFKRKKLIQELVEKKLQEQNAVLKSNPQPKTKTKPERQHNDLRVTSHPGTTRATELKAQAVRQRATLEHQKLRLKTEEDIERMVHQQEVEQRLRQYREKDHQPYEIEEFLRRHDRSLILPDCYNKIKHPRPVFPVIERPKSAMRSLESVQGRLSSIVGVVNIVRDYRYSAEGERKFQVKLSGMVSGRVRYAWINERDISEADVEQLCSLYKKQISSKMEIV